LFCIYSLYEDWGDFRELTDRLPQTAGIALHRSSLRFSSSGRSVQTNAEQLSALASLM
jgi:hypothetical protein